MYTGFPIPRLRVRQNTAGTLDALPAPDLPPWEASESWWQAVLTNPQPSRKARVSYEGRQSFTLADVRAETIEITCTKCEMRRTFATTEVRQRYDGSYSLPGLLIPLAEGCPRLVDHKYSDRCGAVYADARGMLQPKRPMRP
jgi:hypothetical protein